MPRRRSSTQWAPRLLVTFVLFGCLALGVWLAMGSGGGGHASAETTTVRTAPANPNPPPPPPHRVVKRPPPVRPLALPSTLPTGTVALPILMYHRIDQLTPDLPAITRGLTVPPRDFAAEMTWLHSNGYHAVTQRQVFDAVVHGRSLPAKPVLITFDDGYRDVLRYAVPVLQRLHMPATAYVITARISSGDTTWFTWGELRRMERLGWDVGSHTVTHPDLTTLSTGEVTAQLTHSRNALEKHLGHPVQWFAYPSGAENSTVVDLTRQAGYVLAVTTQPGTDQDRSRPLELHRYEVLDTTGVAGLASLLSG
jgi:peptidoglycan/xylan/chitin deacetylase (PgdA/CDA1 family)